MSEQNDMFAGALPKEIGRTELAKISKISVRHLIRLDLEGLEPIGRGRYNLIDAVSWLCNRKQTITPINDQRKALLVEQTKTAKIKNDERLKELIPADQVSNVLNQMGVIIANQLDAMAPRLANELTNQDDPDYVKTTIENETRQIRIAIAGLFDDLASGSGSGVDS